MLLNEKVEYCDGETLLEGYSATASRETRPLVILCHAWTGRDNFICEKANQIASLGFFGFAIDMYGKGVLGKNNAENAALKKPFVENRALLQKRLLAGFEKARSLPYVDAARIAVLGFGFGGLCALDLARTGADIKAAVSIYGHFDPPENCPQANIKAKILILHGYNDPVSTMSDLHQFQQDLDSLNVDWQSHVFGNTFHAFANPAANDPQAGITYNPSASEQAWKISENFLKEALK